MKLRTFILAPMLAALLFTGACSTNPATGKQSFTAFMSQADEVRIGAEEHPKMIKAFGGAYTDATLRAYIKRIGLKLARNAETGGLKFTFTILNDDKVNAFAIPGGYVYITRGLLALAENEAEMAGVLAHEIGHVTARHTAERHSTAQATNLGLMVLGALGSAAGLPAGIGQLAGLGAQAALQSYSREQELEADRLGVRYLSRAGYAPQAMTSFFIKMQAHARLERAMAGDKEDAAHNIMATHPRTANRIAQAIGLEKASGKGRLVMRREQYLNEIDGMVFGDDPDQGVRRGRVFVHPALRIRFEAPPGFVLFNSPRQVIAKGPKKSVMVFDMAKEKSARLARSLKGYIANTWASGLSLSGLQRISINGFDAATASARVRSNDIRLIALRGGPDRIFRLLFVSPPTMTRRLSEDFRRATYSFRRLSVADADAIKPLRIKVVTVKPGDTPKRLAAGFPFERFQLRWFETLNGLRSGDRLSPGTRAKIVAE